MRGTAAAACLQALLLLLAPPSLRKLSGAMAVRKSMEDSFVVSGTREEWLPKCRDALEAGGFRKIDASGTLFQIKAGYKKATV